MYNFYDNFLEEHVAQLIDFEMKEVKWQYDYDSKPNGTQKHWHVFCGHNIDECNLNGYEFIEPIWNNIKNVDSTLELERAYLNAHTYGIEPHIHRDDGDVTLIYYPRLDWKIDWGGGTAIYNDDVTEIEKHFVNKGNRIIMFDANLPHQAQPVAKNCLELRMCVVFKLWTEAANRERLDFYKDKIS